LNSGNGIVVVNYAEARDNVVYDNVDGIAVIPFGISSPEVNVSELGPCLIDGNRVFDNASAGISAQVGSTVIDNVVYSNGVDIQGIEMIGEPFLPFRGAILNNVVYANSTAGILLANGDGARVINNMVFQRQGDGVEVEAAASGDASQNVTLLDNIIWTEAGYDINVANNCQQGFPSNYNLLYTTEHGYIGYWQTSFADLRDWQVEIGLDAQSITGDPMFVNPDGPDGVLGYDSATGVDDGLDDDFHVQNGSPAVAAGDPSSDYSAQPAPAGSRINLGAYGDTPQATTTAESGVIVDPPDDSPEAVSGGADGLITVVLSSQPADDVTIDLTPDGQLTLSRDNLTFTPVDWNVAQQVSVKANSNPTVSGDETATITPTVSSADPNYNGIAVSSIVVQVVRRMSIASPPPVATTESATGITTTAATLNATVIPERRATNVWFAYGTDPALSSDTRMTSFQSVGAGTAAVQVTLPLAELMPGTTYYYGVEGATGGSILSFTTAKGASPPFVSAQTTTGVTATTCTVNASVNPEGSATNVWFVYGTNSALSSGTTTTPEQSIGGGTAAVSVTAALAGLRSGTTYYYEVVAISAAGASDGSILNFTTMSASSSNMPAATTQPATSITSTAATLVAIVNPEGSATTVSFVYGTSPALSTATTTLEQSIAGGSATVSVAASLRGLMPGTPYYYRVVATSAVGTTFGSILSFTTSPTSQDRTPVMTTIISEQPLFKRKLDKKGRPIGKPKLRGFMFEFDVPLNAGTAMNPENYQLGTITTKKIKNKNVRILHPISNFTVSYVAASETVEIMLGAVDTFPAGGRITVFGPLTTASGGILTGNAVYTIARSGRSVAPA
jgi:hypothetical protein